MNNTLYIITRGYWLTTIDKNDRPNFLCCHHEIFGVYDNSLTPHSVIEDIRCEADKRDLKYKARYNNDGIINYIAIFKQETVNGKLEEVCDIYEIETSELNVRR